MKLSRKQTAEINSFRTIVQTSIYGDSMDMSIHERWETEIPAYKCGGEFCTTDHVGVVGIETPTIDPRLTLIVGRDEQVLTLTLTPEQLETIVADMQAALDAVTVRT